MKQVGVGRVVHNNNILYWSAQPCEVLNKNTVEEGAVLSGESVGADLVGIEDVHERVTVVVQARCEDDYFEVWGDTSQKLSDEWSDPTIHL